MKEIFRYFIRKNIPDVSNALSNEYIDDIGERDFISTLMKY